MDSLFLLQFACFIFMLLNAAIVAVSHLHVKWESKRYERSRWMIVAAMIGLAIQYMMQMFFGFRAADDGLGAVINILVYTPCFSLISMGIYNLEAPRISCRKMNRVCGGIYAVILLVFCVSIYLHQSLGIERPKPGHRETRLWAHSAHCTGNECPKQTVRIGQYHYMN
jgi:uncharacterized protein YqgC (DUF456 family)